MWGEDAATRAVNSCLDDLGCMLLGHTGAGLLVRPRKSFIKFWLSQPCEQIPGRSWIWVKIKAPWTTQPDWDSSGIPRTSIWSILIFARVTANGFWTVLTCFCRLAILGVLHSQRFGCKDSLLCSWFGACWAPFIYLKLSQIKLACKQRGVFSFLGLDIINPYHPPVS